MRSGVIDTYSQNLRAQFSNLLVLVSKSASFHSTAWSVILWIEVKNHFLSRIVCQPYRLARCDLSSKVGSFHAGLDLRKRFHTRQYVVQGFMRIAESEIGVSFGVFPPTLSVMNRDTA